MSIMAKLSTHNGVYAAPFAQHGSEVEIRVYAHDSGQRFHWAYSIKPVVDSCNQWFQDALTGRFPTECVGVVELIPLSWITEADEYVGSC